MKLIPPIANFKWNENISQLFGVSKEIYLSKFGIPGHNALDIVVADGKRGFGTEILATHDGIIESIKYDVPHQTAGNGVKILSNDGTFSTVYWHLSEFRCQIGQQVRQGDVIGLMGATGYVTPPPTEECPYCGTHLHFGVQTRTANEYGGYVDPTPYIFSEGDKLPVRLFSTLMFGSSGDQVAWLQTMLKLELGNLVTFEPNGNFGPQTFKAVRLLQEKYYLSSVGIVGPQTRQLLNSRLCI